MTFPLFINMTSRLSGHFSIFGLALFVLKSLLGIARRWSRKKKKKCNFDPKTSESCQNFNISNAQILLFLVSILVSHSVGTVQVI